MNKLYVIAGAAILVIALYAVFFAQKEFSFDSGLAEINLIWEKQGLKPADLVNPLMVYATEQSNLAELKSGLTSYRNSVQAMPESDDREKIDLLLETELSLVDNALLQKKNFDLIDFFDSSGYDYSVLCNSISKAESLQESLVLQKNSAESFNEKLMAFLESYPAEAEKAGIGSLNLEVNSDEKLSEFESIVSALKVVC
ncbi:MAG: hypothetical protein ABH986_06145 [archaeon]